MKIKAHEKSNFVFMQVTPLLCNLRVINNRVHVIQQIYYIRDLRRIFHFTVISYTHLLTIKVIKKFIYLYDSLNLERN